MTTRAPDPYQPLIDALPGEWVHEAACADVPFKDFWHPSSEDGRDPKAEADYAKKICRGCPVRDECLEWAMDVGPALAQGILGGVSEDERRKMWRSRKAAA
jgi:WhiB family redox-sensing transcriptional regulator